MGFRICMIGCGGMAVNGHGPMQKKYASMRPTVELSACCDVSRGRAEYYASAFGFGQAFTDIDEMLESVQIDGAVLAVPVDLTAKLSIKMLKRHIPILTEKPPGVSMDEGKAIAAAAKEAGVPASVAFNRRTMPLVSALIRELGTVGEAIDSVTIDMSRIDRTDADFSTTAIHSVDLARYLCRSDYRTARFAYQPLKAGDIFMLAEMDSGAVADLGFHPMSGVHSERVAVRLRGHTIFADLPVYGSMDANGKIVHIMNNDPVNIIAGLDYDDPAEANGFLGEYTSFFDALLEGRTPEHSVEESLQSLALACCIRGKKDRYIK